MREVRRPFDGAHDMEQLEFEQILNRADWLNNTICGFVSHREPFHTTLRGLVQAKESNVNIRNSRVHAIFDLVSATKNWIMGDERKMLYVQRQSDEDFPLQIQKLQILNHNMCS